MAAEVLSRHSEKHNVATQLNYWDDPCDGLPPTPIYIGKGRITNERPHRPHNFTISDVSGDEQKYTLDSHGFQYCCQKSTETDFVDDKKIEAEYYPECEKLLKDVTGASRIHIFNHKVRRGPTHWHHLGLKNLANRGPVTKTHVDQSYDGAEKRLRWELPDEANELVKKRYQIINIWRPIKKILKDPIAVADANTVPDRDLVAAVMVENDFPGEQWVVRQNPGHKWYFKHQLSPEEVLLIKCFDSDTTVARRALHSAFEDQAYQNEESRQSIEVRCLVFYE
ncbi:Gibberellin cluster GA4 desaturase [Lachnellula suecica]|uniref:Gibberellin cluster GA4 desaturase n=1 Tax=Lachnellula suecica TaxID=602035 RepID=A0A8T9C5E0_9HELO|nr:Gibberellin cluster GA4 desaturase [Lachnellula suecica]